jgi:hypothetical protein
MDGLIQTWVAESHVEMALQLDVAKKPDREYQYSLD